jgi:hypothetical protein
VCNGKAPGRSAAAGRRRVRGGGGGHRCGSSACRVRPVNSAAAHCGNRIKCHGWSFLLLCARRPASTICRTMVLGRLLAGEVSDCAFAANDVVNHAGILTDSKRACHCLRLSNSRRASTSATASSRGTIPVRSRSRRRGNSSGTLFTFVLGNGALLTASYRTVHSLY